jgi:hypothetical protein
VTAVHATAALAEVVVTLGETILDVRHVGPSAGRGAAWSPWLPRFIVGEGPTAHLPAAVAGQDGSGTIALVESAGAGIRVRLAAGMTGTIERGGTEATVAALLAGGTSQVILQAGEAAVILVGPALVTIRVEACTPVEKFRATLDRPLWLSQGGALTLLAVLMIVVHRTPPSVEAPRFDDPDVQARLIRYLTPAEDAAAEPATATTTTSSTMTAPRSEPRAAEQMDAPEVDAVGPIAAISRTLRGQGAAEAAAQSGIFGVAGFMAALERAAADADASRQRYVAAGADDSAFIAAAAKAAPTVLTGLGLANTGRQGGGLAAGAIDFDWSWILPPGGLRSMDPKRMRARAEKERFASREPAAALPERRQNVAWTGSVGRDLIRGVVNRNKPDVRRCFRDGMLKNPELTGEVEVAFTIQSDGAVAYASVANSTLEDAAVEACVTESIKRWKFPVFVASGGDVDVRFPFTVGKA